MQVRQKHVSERRRVNVLPDGRGTSVSTRQPDTLDNRAPGDRGRENLPEPSRCVHSLASGQREGLPGAGGQRRAGCPLNPPQAHLTSTPP